MAAELLLLNVPKDSWIGIWTGVEGRVGEGFLGFHSVPLGGVVLVRIGESSVVLVQMDKEKVVLAKNSNGDSWSRVDDDVRGSVLTSNYQQRLIDANNPSMQFSEQSAGRLGIPLHQRLDAEDLASITWLVSPDLKSFRNLIEEEDVDNYASDSLSLTFALFVCTSSVECFNVWSKLMRLIEMVSVSKVLPARLVDALTEQLTHIPSDLLEENARLREDLKRVILTVLTHSKRHPRLSSFSRLNEAAGNCFHELKDRLMFSDGESETDDDNEFLPVIVNEVKPSPLPLSSDTPPSDTLPVVRSSSAGSVGAKRMEWML